MADQHRNPDELLHRVVEVPSYLAAVLASALATTVGYLVFGRDQLPDVVMIYLLGIMLVSSRYGFGPSIVAALSSVAAFDFFFVPPFLTFAVGDFRHATTFAVMFLVAIVVSALTQRIRSQARAARHREERTRALYELSRGLAGAEDRNRVVEVAAGQLEIVFGSQVSVFAPDAHRRLIRLYASPGLGPLTDRDAGVAQWVWSNRHEAGLGTTTLPTGRALYVPLTASSGIVGVLGLCSEERDRFESPEQRRQLDAFAAQMALAMERAELAEETDRARREVETEQLRSSLLSSVSHDLRTPLAVITGAASTVVEGGASLDDATRQDLLKTILEEAERLNRLIRNLLDMTRLESGSIDVKKEWLPLEEVVGSALNRLDAPLVERDVRVDVPRDLPLVPFDPILVEQTLINLLENAAKYSRAEIEISVQATPGEVMVEVSDRGPGVPPGEEARIFEKFHRATHERGPAGVGLGLAICRAIVMAHGGRIWAQNRDEGGAAFRFTLPIHGEAPKLVLTEPSEEASEGATR
jgi:two-component system sensor histidine kinase KdpD